MRFVIVCDLPVPGGPWMTMLASVAYNEGGIGEIVLSGKTGLLVAPGNVDALAEALTSLCTDAGLRDSMGEAGRSRALAFDPITAARKFWEALRACAGVLRPAEQAG